MKKTLLFICIILISILTNACAAEDNCDCNYKTLHINEGKTLIETSVCKVTYVVIAPGGYERTNGYLIKYQRADIRNNYTSFEVNYKTSYYSLDKENNMYVAIEEDNILGWAEGWGADPTLKELTFKPDIKTTQWRIY